MTQTCGNDKGKVQDLVSRFDDSRNEEGTSSIQLEQTDVYVSHHLLHDLCKYNVGAI